MIWFVIFAFLFAHAAVLVPWFPYVKNKFDVLTKGKYNKDVPNLNFIYASILEKPDEWLIDNDKARYPREGNAALIYLNRDEKGKLQYSISARNIMSREITGYYERKISEEMKKAKMFRDSKYLINTLFPEDDRFKFLLENKS